MACGDVEHVCGEDFSCNSPINCCRQHTNRYLRQVRRMFSPELMSFVEHIKVVQAGASLPSLIHSRNNVRRRMREILRLYIFSKYLLS